MNEAQKARLVFAAQELEMDAGRIGNEAATLEAQVRALRAEQARQLTKAQELRSGLQ